jgi:predicted acyl esterase
LDFAAKELDAAGKSENDSAGPLTRNRPTSPTTIHPTIAASRSDKIEVRESQSAGVFLAGHNLRIPVTTAQEAFKLINRGLKNRATGSTQCNDISSR